ERRANLTHAVVAEPAEAADEGGDGYVLDRVEIHGRSLRNRILVRLESHFTGNAADRSRARPHNGPPETWDRSVPRKDDDRAASYRGKLAPPDLSASRKRRHDLRAASLNDARSPHSSGVSSGTSSY